MTAPSLFFLGPDGSNDDLKVYLKSLIYCTSNKGRLIENMYVKLQRGETSQNFNIWVHGEKDNLSRGSGLFVGQNGVVLNHHFLLPKDGSRFYLLAGNYKLNVYAMIVGENKGYLLETIRFEISETQENNLKEKGAGIFFDRGVDTIGYVSYVEIRKEKPDDLFESMLAFERVKRSDNPLGA
ncbi:hypothetical protein EHO60_13300 [Leptospira fletcheri]|uniref:Uncharacterized protein n=1 Tax=Leptospira fletcheri TaxID=2484981 RepID=A0A4R9GC70_9LEPT|nr:hypothetical protein [Leptospira fletcheri]TGK08995.1 hypothetical protein EHO60_13300 [Leptospira fletcheri]